LRGGFYEDDEHRLWFFADKVYLVEEREAQVLFNEVDFDLPDEYAAKTILSIKKIARRQFLGYVAARDISQTSRQPHDFLISSN
jgi:hypothetical protein